MLIVHNAGYEGMIAERQFGIRWTGTGVRDTMLLSKRVHPAASASLEALTVRYLPEIAGFKGETESLLATGLSWEELPRDVLLRRNALDAWALPRLHDLLWDQLSLEERAHHPEDIAMSLFVQRMAGKGLRVSLERLVALGSETSGRMDTARGRLAEVVGFDVNPASSHQTGPVLADLGAALPRTPAGALGTSEKVLRVARLTASGRLAEAIDAVLAYRKSATVRNRYAKGYAKLLDGDGHLRSRFRGEKGGMFWPGTVSWRPTSTEANLLNIPRDPLVRRCVVAPPGCALMEVDLKQGELRVVTALSGEPTFRDVFLKGGDPHSMTATDIGSGRPIAKTFNFQTLYQGGAYGIWLKLVQAGVRVSLQEVKKYLKIFWRKRPILWDYAQTQMEAARYGETLRSPTGAYKWKLDDLMSKHPDRPDEAERATFNATIQSVPTRIVLRMGLKAEAAGVDVRLCTYDGLLCYVPLGDVPEVARLWHRLNREETGEDWWQGISCPIDIKVGPSWGETQELAA